MLSAIAARKAAQAAKNEASIISDSPVPSKDLSNESDSDTETLNTILQPKKRRPERQSVETSLPSKRKKRRREKDAKESTRVRYFNEPVKKDEVQIRDASDAIAIDLTDEQDSDLELDLEIGDAEQRELPISSEEVVLDDLPGVKPAIRKRAWSPSQPFNDSSEDEDIIAEPVSGYDAKINQGESPSLLTTFSPKLGENLFFLEPPEVALLCAGRINEENATRSTLVTLSPGESISFIGTYSMTLLRGSISVSGVDLFPSHLSHTIFAPRCSPIPVITASDSPTSSLVGVDFMSVERLKSLQDTAQVILLLQSLFTGVEGLGQICRTFEGVFRASDTVDVLQLDSAHLIHRQAPYVQGFNLPPSWNLALTSLSPPYLDAGNENSDITNTAVQCPMILVKGPKNVGKSTFARTLLSRLVTRYRKVAFLECDLGQTEFTPPGMVSLNIVEQPVFGPPFTHPTIPYQAHFVGSSSPRPSPSSYLTSIESLLRTYRSEIQYSSSSSMYDDKSEVDSRMDDVVPIVVNTMGWNKGLGADLTRRIEELLEPTHVISFREPVVRGRSGDMFYNSRNEQDSAMVDEDMRNPAIKHDVDPITESPLRSRYNANDWRNISLVSYFHARLPLPLSILCFPGDDTISSPASKNTLMWDASLPLISVPPYVVDPDVAFDNIVLVGPGTEDVVSAEIGRVLNGAIVALVRYQPGTEQVVESNSQRVLKYTQGSPPPDPFVSSCIGLALIRAVSPSLIYPDEERTEPPVLHILTPVSPVLLGLTRCLVKGDIEIPVWCMIDFREIDSRQNNKEQEKNVPYLQWSRLEGAGADPRRVRRNIMRRSQM